MVGYAGSLWRAMNTISHDFDDAPDPESVQVLRRAFAAMPEPDRIALARELLAGTGRVVAKDVPVSNKFDNWWHGWNAARAAMLGDEG